MVSQKQIADKKKELICMEDEVLVQEFGLYTPQYDFASALDYKEELATDSPGSKRPHQR